MKLIIGLGNPGKEYQSSRHNVGFMVLDRIIQKTPSFPLISLKSLRWRQRVGAAVVETRQHPVSTDEAEKIILAAPQKFINSSGLVVRDLKKFYDLENNDLIVICDDLNLEFGQIRVRRGGASGNHNGLKSIIEQIGENFLRIRIGIKNQFLQDASQWHDFVLSPFLKEEKEKLPKLLDLTAETVLEWIRKENSLPQTTFKL